MKSFQDQITELRARNKKITQQALADALDVSVFTVQKWEQGKCKPTKLTQQAAIQEVLNWDQNH